MALLLPSVGSIAQTATQNYVRTRTLRSYVKTSALLDQYTPLKDSVMTTIQYIDGLGRPSQTVQVKGSTGLKDVVQPVAYDAFGREAIKYQPYASPSSDGSYKTNAISTELSNFYNPAPGGTSGTQQSNGIVYSPNPYSLTSFESSPLNRVTEQGAPGTPWQPVAGSTSGHTVKMVYTTNNLTAITNANSFIATLYNATINSDLSRTLTVGNSQGNYYQPGQLNVTVSYDENWTSGKPGSTEEYKDKEGRVVLRRTFNLVGTTVEVLSTYYVYDNLGNLAFVLSPMSNGDAGITSAANLAVLNSYCYQYQYDQRNRPIQKRLPGKDWEYMIYNKLDQVVATQDGVQRAKSTQEWTFTKYDGQGRVAYWGIYQYPGSVAGTSYRAALQTTMNGETVLWETQQATGTGYNGTAWPHANITRYLQLNYYDNYTFPGNPYVPTVSGTVTAPVGLLTASKTAVLLPDGTYGSMLWSVSYYDTKGRQIQKLRQHYLGGEAGLNNNNYDEVNDSYDFTGALTASIRHHYVAGAQTLITSTSYTYDHMGRKLQTKEAIATGTNALPIPTILSQAIYNEVGQLKTKRLHSANNGASYLQDIGYTYNERGWLQQSSAPLFAMQLKYNNGTTPQFNGNITSQLWGTPGSLGKTYTYSYDKLNRLTAGISNEGYSEQAIDYDLNGNIRHLTRQVNPAYTYTYSGNQLQTVSGITTGTYTYDLNGNAKYDAHTGKTTTVYNLLNLPSTITATGLNLTYTYNAAGQKLRKNNGTINTEYIGGIQYENGTIIFVQTEEGRALKSGANYIYEYSLTDHLGNTRLSFDQNSATVLKQQDDYFPFGMEISRGSVVSPKNNYLYNKKELQSETGLYDYGARFYDPVIARWTTPDPLSEKLPGWSPYNYVLNNPMKLFDPDGLFPFSVTIRAFAPPGSFSGTGFNDDKRGFSASSDASSRLSQTTTIDPTSGQVEGGHVTSTGTHFLGIPVGNAENFSSEGAVDRITTSGTGDDHTLSVDQHLTGSDPAGLKLAPSVLLNSSIRLTENDKAGYLDANVSLTSKGFPTSEAIIQDTGGKTLLLTGAASYGGLSDLIKNDPKQVASINVRISIDGKGNFTSVTYNGKTYSVAAWNKAQQAAPAGPHHNYGKQNIQGQTEQ